MQNKTLTSFRRAQVGWGDTIQRFAVRETGDASNWTDVVEINELRPPYVAETASEGVAAYGAILLVPASGIGKAPWLSSVEEILGADVLLTDGRISADGGDIVLTAGVPNLRQALQHVIRTDKKEIIFHPTYGCKVHRLRGEKNDETNLLLGEVWVREAVLGDDRVSMVSASNAIPDGDALRIDLTVDVAIGDPIDVSLTV